MGGEDQVWRTLERLVARDPRWWLDRDVEVVGGDVLVGPGGVYCLSVHDVSDASVWVQGDALKVDGTNTPFVRARRRAIARCQARLDGAVGFGVTVQGLVVLASSKHFTVKREPDAVAVVEHVHLSDWLRALPPALLPGESRAVHRAVTTPA